MKTKRLNSLFYLVLIFSMTVLLMTACMCDEEDTPMRLLRIKIHFIRNRSPTPKFRQPFFPKTFL